MKLQHGKSTFMKKLHPKYAVGIPINSGVFSTGFLPDPSIQYSVTPSPSNEYTKIRKRRASSVIPGMSKFGEWVYNFAQGFREHVKLGPKLTETLKGKLRLGTRILLVGGLEKVFKLNFNVSNGEKLLTASQCYLSTTAGPIAGLLFISTDKIAFCSERSIKLSSPTGKLHKIHYKVMIPLRKIKRANESENAKKPRQKYVQIVTEDKFEFWFMGFLNHQKALKYLQHATSQTPSATAIDAWMISP
ncbi:putative GEM-like protein 8 [Olea europaea var. sylvestris]|uniref:putative GEM-like protein 8 n=1 Tax=Olea europaea var. sylvestris TaxID=158386 RepID=UPI000C1CE811|nr:putative GEM-like protein 8 [Olea europaea var. sylvestris]